MRQMKDSGIEWIGEIPQTWDVLKTKFCFRYKKEIAGINSDKFDRLALTMQNVVKRAKDDSNGLQPEKFETYQILRRNELVFKLIDLQNVSTSRVGLSPYDGIVSPAYIILTPQSNISSKYAEKYYYTLWKNQIFNALGDDGVRSNLGKDDLLNIPIPVPPLAEQERIAEFLDEKCAEVDALAGEIKEQIATLEEYKRSVITEAVTKGLDASVPMKDSGIEWIGEIPQAWDVRKGKYLFAQRNERGNNVKLQLLSPTQNYGVIPQDEYERLSGMSAVKLNENINLKALKTIHKGDYCISLRSFQGGFEYSMNEGVISPAYQVFYPTVKISGGYYKYLFKDKGFISVINSYAMSLRDGKNISFEQFGNTVIPVPPLAEQERIAEFLDAKCAEVDALIAEKQNQLATLEEYKKSVIFEYVTGKKEVV